MATKPTTVAKSVSIQLGLATVFGSLRTVRNTEKATAYRTLCPACLAADPTNGVPVRQVYTCDHNHGPFLPADVKAKGREVGDRIIPLSDEDLAAVADSGDEGDDGTALSLQVHPAEQVPHIARPTGIVYAFDPGPGKAEMVGVLLAMIAEGRYALMGELTIKKVRRVFRLVAADHGLELVEIARPEDVYDFGAREYPVSDRTRHLAEMLTESLVTDYDPEAYRDGSAERLAAILAAKEDGSPIPVTALPSPAAGGDLEAMLAASLAALQTEAA